MLGPGNAPLYSSKIYGLPFTPMFTTTQVRMDRKRMSPEMVSSSSSPQSLDGDDNDYDGDDTMEHEEEDDNGDNGDAA